MTATALKSIVMDHNPLDLAEMVMMERDWAFDRTDESELVGNAVGMWCHYRVWFTWNDEMNALMLCVGFDHKLPKKLQPKVLELMALANEKIWLGHFDVSSEDESITYRHSVLVREGVGTTSEQLQDLLDIAIKECERFYPALQAVLWGNKAPAEALQFSMFETVAEA